MVKIRFESWRSYWRFEASVRRAHRFFRSREDAAFLDMVLESSKSFNETLNAGSLLWRAQLGHDLQRMDLGDDDWMDEPCPYPPERMLPLRDEAVEGRANPKGIPLLYAATDEDTAMAEVRPWVGSLVSVGTFEVLRDLKVVNFALAQSVNHIFLAEPSPKKRAAAVWNAIDRAFSTPVTPRDSLADYAPTQVIAEMFRDAGLDGIAYRSALGQGHNVALFDLEAVLLRHCRLFEARSLHFEFSECANPYFVPRGEDS